MSSVASETTDLFTSAYFSGSDENVSSAAASKDDQTNNEIQHKDSSKSNNNNHKRAKSTNNRESITSITRLSSMDGAPSVDDIVYKTIAETHALLWHSSDGQGHGGGHGHRIRRSHDMSIASKDKQFITSVLADRRFSVHQKESEDDTAAADMARRQSQCRRVSLAACNRRGSIGGNRQRRQSVLQQWRQTPLFDGQQHTRRLSPATLAQTNVLPNNRRPSSTSASLATMGDPRSSQGASQRAARHIAVSMTIAVAGALCLIIALASKSWMISSLGGAVLAVGCVSMVIGILWINYQAHQRKLMLVGLATSGGASTSSGSAGHQATVPTSSVIVH